MDRILASHYSYGEGLDPSKVCFVLAPSFAAGAKCIGQEVGQLQPYAIYVPPKPRPKRGYGMTLLLHSLSANYNQYLGSRNQSQLGDRGPGSIVITPSGRGPDGFYAGIAEADTFETWADVARHYKLDPDWTIVSGYSMGGFGVYRLLARWPDLFARGFSVVGAPGSVNDQLISLRNTPLLLWNATADELVNLQSSEAAVTADAAAGLHFTEDLFLTADHLTLAANDQYAPGAAWLGTYRVNRDPNQVSFVVDTTEDSAVAKSVADHAYWLAGMRPRGKGDASVVVLSDAFGTPPPATVSPLVEGAGVLTGGEIPALAYRSRTQAFIPSGVAAAKRNLLVITATNLATLVIDIKRAHVTCGVRLSVKTDGPLAITLSGCNRTLHFTH
jgi:pimeloyl-ACP methyl ester carboxylesterase